MGPSHRLLTAKVLDPSSARVSSVMASSMPDSAPRFVHCRDRTSPCRWSFTVIPPFPVLCGSSPDCSVRLDSRSDPSSAISGTTSLTTVRDVETQAWGSSRTFIWVGPWRPSSGKLGPVGMHLVDPSPPVCVVDCGPSGVLIVDEPKENTSPCQGTTVLFYVTVLLVLHAHFAVMGTELHL